MPSLIPGDMRPGTWADTTMRRPALQVAHALLIGNEEVSIALAIFLWGKGMRALTAPLR